MKHLRIFFFLVLTFSFGHANAWSKDVVWEKNDATQNYELVVSKKIDSIECKKNHSLRFPNIMHSSQYLYMDGQLISLFGKESPAHTQSIYGAPVIPCEVLEAGSEITWKVFSPIKYFSKLRTYPYVSNNNSPINISDLTNLLIIGSLFIFVLLLLTGPRNSELYQQSLRLAGFSFFMAIFFISSVVGLIGFNTDYLLVDKIACVFLGLATILFIDFLRVRELISSKVGYSLSAISLIGTVPIFFLQDGDQIQGFLNIIFGPAFLVVWLPFYDKIKNVFTKGQFNLNLQYFALLCFALAATSDILYTLGVHNFGFSLGYGVFGTVLFFTSAIQSDIKTTYHLLEHLQKNLEDEVEQKTHELSEALANLKSTQAELIQQEKMASLGTLSAGIAHEINNSINYVNACLEGLRRQINKVVSSDSSEYKKIEQLLDTVKHGTKVTIDIVSSLRSYTGLNQAKWKTVNFDEIVNSVTTIAKSKIKNTTIELKYEKEIEVYCSVVGLNQVLMNLITNAVDALEGVRNPKVIIDAKKNNEGILIEVKDNGPGIPEDIITHIFDPFFTTKDVGRGTGLGLYLIKKEIEENHKGKITVRVEGGTQFLIFIPQEIESKIEGAA